MGHGDGRAAPGRYGALKLNGNGVDGFQEKPAGDGGVINGGFFVLSPKCIELIEGDRISWRRSRCRNWRRGAN